MALPVLTFVKAFKWFVAWLTPENVRGKVVLIAGASSGIGEVRKCCYLSKYCPLERPGFF